MIVSLLRLLGEAALSWHHRSSLRLGGLHPPPLSAPISLSQQWESLVGYSEELCNKKSMIQTEVCCCAAKLV